MVYQYLYLYFLKTFSRINPLFKLLQFFFGVLQQNSIGYCSRIIWLCVVVALQWLPFENGQIPFYVVNDVTLTGQKPSLKLCQPLELFTQFEKGLDLLILKIWGLQVKGLQSYQPSNFVLVHSSAFTAEESAIALGTGLRTPGVKSFSKFDGQ